MTIDVSSRALEQKRVVQSEVVDIASNFLAEDKVRQ